MFARIIKPQVLGKKISSLLIHEVVHAIAGFSTKDVLLRTEGMEPRTKDHLNAVKQELHIEELLGLSVWIDGCPHDWDRSQSLEVASINFPGLTGKWKN